MSENGNATVKKETWKSWYRSAVKNNDLKALKFLTKSGGDVLLDKELLIIACTEGFVQIVKYLLKKGADISYRGNLAMTSACTQGHTKIVEMLYESGADITFNDGWPLRAAVANNHVEIVRFLIEKKVNIDVHNNAALHVAVSKKYTEIAKLLIEAGATVKKQDTLLCDACENGDVEIVNALISKGVDVNYKAPIINACECSNIHVVKALISAGADVTVKHNMAIQVAAVKGYQHIVEELLNAGADPTDSDCKAIKNAVTNEETAVIKIFASRYKKDFVKEIIRDVLRTDEKDKTYCRFVRIVEQYGLE